jgi:hypothetical protein
VRTTAAASWGSQPINPFYQKLQLQVSRKEPTSVGHIAGSSSSLVNL